MGRSDVGASREQVPGSSPFPERFAAYHCAAIGIAPSAARNITPERALCAHGGARHTGTFITLRWPWNRPTRRSCLVARTASVASTREVWG